MTEDELFSAVLRELSFVISRLGPVGARTVLIGGQVLAIEGLRQGGTGVIEARTDTGVVVERGFSLEPDLLVDLEADRFFADQLPEILRAQGFERVRDYRWAKEIEGGAPRRIEIDLFRGTDVEPESVPTAMTVLPDADLVLRRSVPVEVSLGEQVLRIRVPDTLSFLAMKIRAKREQRPNATKDCFDIYAYVQLHGAAEISRAMTGAGSDGLSVLRELRGLFWSVDAPGVQDVLASAIGLGPDERALLAQAVVDLFADL